MEVELVVRFKREERGRSDCTPKMNLKQYVRM